MDDIPLLDTELIRSELMHISIMMPADLYAPVWEHIEVITQELKKFERATEVLPEEPPFGDIPAEA